VGDFHNALMEKKYSTHSWLGSFAGRLIQLWPSMHIGSAVQCAVMSIHYAVDLDPRQAAELFATANPTLEPKPVPTKRSAPAKESQTSRYRTMFGSRLTERAAAR
jgi:hypothetical protein